MLLAATLGAKSPVSAEMTDNGFKEIAKEMDNNNPLGATSITAFLPVSLAFDIITILLSPLETPMVEQPDNYRENWRRLGRAAGDALVGGEPGEELRHVMAALRERSENVRGMSDEEIWATLVQMGSADIALLRE